MAGLTREQRAEREAAKLAEQQQQDGAEMAAEVEQVAPTGEVAENGAGQSPEANPDEGDNAGDAIAYVMMVRDPDKYDAPHTAQVHPDEVVNYYSGGWVEDK
ncbi:TPA: hypothetical protein ACQ431_003003 [Citrobacter murliniae]